MNNKDNIEEMLRKAMLEKTDPRLRAEETLLNDDDKEHVKPKNIEKKKRRCANCTCSLSRGGSVPDCPTGEEKVVISKPKSGCGNCSKGDAFRCDGCPYRGMPAFEEGKEFKFDDNLNDL